MALYPVNLNLEGKVCIVIGGGKVAARKVAGLCRGGAAVRLVSPEIIDEMRPWLEGHEETTPVEWFEREYALGDLQDVFLAFAATSSPAVQRDIRKEAAQRNVLLNIVDDPDNSGFHVPGHFRRGDVLVTASTGGESPALAASLRQRLEETICPEYDLVNRLLGSVREAVLAAGGTTEEHGRIFNELMNGGIVEQILQGEWFRVQQMLCSALPPGIDGSKITARFIEEGEESGLIKPLSLR